MGVYTRFKKSSDGFRSLVQLLETTPTKRRQKMIDVGMAEDPEYTKKALQFTLSFLDILGMPDSELTEVIAESSAEIVGYAISLLDEEAQDRFLWLAPPKSVPVIRETLDLPATPTQIGAAQSKMVESARKLEKRGIVKTKRIPG